MSGRAKLVITGPTGVGKTAYVDAIARRFPIEVVCMDSCQVYSFFRVGTGRADGSPNVIRHLYGFVSPHETLSVASYVAKARALVHEIEHRGRIPLFEGGSRSFLAALIDALPLQIYGLRPSKAPGWIEAMMEKRVRGFLAGDAIIHEVEAGLSLGYADTRLMRDPMIYMQTRAYLAGELSREELARVMVTSMKEMHDDQLRVLAKMPIDWIDVDSCTPPELVEIIRDWLGDPAAPMFDSIPTDNLPARRCRS
jgi:tRNA A37 N6-isopentenylltransferase MiaA